MTPSHLFFGIASALVLSGCACPSRPDGQALDQGKIKAEAIATAHARIDALNAHDAAQNVSYDRPDIVAMFHGAPNDVGVKSDLATTKAMVGDPLVHVDLSAESVDSGGPDFAVYHATYDLTTTDFKTKAAAHERGNLLLGFKRQADGALKVAWEIVSDTPPAR